MSTQEESNVDKKLVTPRTSSDARGQKSVHDPAH